MTIESSKTFPVHSMLEMVGVSLLEYPVSVDKNQILNLQKDSDLIIFWRDGFECAFPTALYFINFALQDWH